jgi:3-oxoacyl-[acyl-carrier-protein] synthase-3
MATIEITRPAALTELGQATLRRLMRQWFEFERRLATVPIVRRLDLGTFNRVNYQRLLLNLRPQVVEGSRWISRCASSFERDKADIRPVGLLGAMWIIEGLGEKMAGNWAGRVEELTGFDRSCTRFLRYHADNDDTHLDKLYGLIDRICTQQTIADDVVGTARVVGRLYALQLEEIDVDQ